MKKKIVSLVLAGCLFGGGMGFTANAAEVEDAVAETSVDEAAQPEESAEEVSETETSAEETVDVEIADEETPLAGPEVEIGSESDEAEVEVEVDEDDIPVEFDMGTGDIELELEEVDENEKVDITPLEEVEKDGVEISDEEVPLAGEEVEAEEESEEDAEAETEKKTVSKLTTIYTQDENGKVHKITRAITVDENGNESVDERDEEYGFIGKDGGFYTIGTKIEQDRVYEINVEYVKDVQKIMSLAADETEVEGEAVDNREDEISFTITDEIVSVDLSYTTIVSEDQEGPVTSEDANIQAIFDKVNMPEKLDTGVDIVAHIDENGVVTEISATATEPIVRDREVMIAEAAEMDFEFNKEYVEEDVVMEVEVEADAKTEGEAEEISIEDEETPLAGDMQDAESEDEESKDVPEEVIKKVEATKEVAIVDELSDADADAGDEDSDADEAAADEAAADDAAEEVIDAVDTAEETTEVVAAEVSVEEISETVEDSVEE